MAADTATRGKLTEWVTMYWSNTEPTVLEKLVFRQIIDIDGCSTGGLSGVPGRCQHLPQMIHCTFSRAKAQLLLLLLYSRKDARLDSRGVETPHPEKLSLHPGSLWEMSSMDELKWS